MQQQQRMDGDACVAEFDKRKRAWVWVAAPAAGALLLSIITTELTGGVFALQVLGLVMLMAFAVASAVLCRCPDCSKFLLNKKDLLPGWTFHRCPHCDAPLRGKKSGRR